MEQRPTTGESVANVADEWAAEDPWLYQFLVGRSPPRTGGCFRLVKSDACNPRALLLWVAGVVMLLAGAAAACVGVQVGWLWLALPGLAVAFAGPRTRWYTLAPVWLTVLAAIWVLDAADRPELAYPGLLAAFIGARLLAIMVFSFLLSLRNLQCGAVLRGVIRSVRRFPHATGVSTADVLLPDGRTVRALVKTDLVSALLDQDGRAEVLAVVTPGERQGRVIAVRPRAGGRAEIGPAPGGQLPPLPDDAHPTRWGLAEGEPDRCERSSPAPGRAEAARLVRWPARGLAVVGWLGIGAGVCRLFLHLVMVGSLLTAPGELPRHPEMRLLGVFLVLGVDLAFLAWGALVVLGAGRLRRRRTYGLALAGAVVALMPANYFWLLGLPFGVWALVVLNRPEVKEAFEEHLWD